MATSQKRRILIPVDNSDACERAVKWGIENVIRPETDIVIVIHVVSDAPKGTSFSALWSFISDDGAPDSHIDKVGAHTELVTDPHHPMLNDDPSLAFIKQRFGQPLKAAGIKHRLDIVQFSDDANSVGQVICANAIAVRADMILMSSHNKTALEEMFLGSTSQWVSHHVKVPLILCHDE